MHIQEKNTLQAIYEQQSIKFKVNQIRVGLKNQISFKGLNQRRQYKELQKCIVQQEGDIERFIYSTRWQAEKQNARQVPHAGREWAFVHKSLQASGVMDELSKPEEKRQQQTQQTGWYSQETTSSSVTEEQLKRQKVTRGEAGDK